MFDEELCKMLEPCVELISDLESDDEIELVSKPDVSEPDVPEPDVPEPDVSIPDVSEPGPSKPMTEAEQDNDKIAIEENYKHEVIALENNPENAEPVVKLSADELVKHGENGEKIEEEMTMEESGANGVKVDEAQGEKTVKRRKRKIVDYQKSACYRMKLRSFWTYRNYFYNRK